MLKVLGLGDNLVDKYLYKKMMYPGGNAYNFAVLSNILGVESSYMGVFGGDTMTDFLKKPLEEYKIDYSRCKYVSDENGYTEVELEDGDRIIHEGNRGGSTRTSPLRIALEDIAYIEEFDLVHTSCYSFIESELHKITHIGTKISFDFSECWEEEYIVKICPHLDFGFFSCSHVNENVARQTLINAYENGCSIAIATMGEQGALFYNGSTFHQKKSYRLDGPVVDTMAAGDSFIAAFLVNYNIGMKQKELARGEKPADLGKHQKDFIEALVEYSMAAGHMFAAKNCMVEGSFGWGEPINNV